MSYFQNLSAHWITPFSGGAFGVVGGLIIIAVIVWSLAWKGMALWRAARTGAKWWFIALLAVNTFGILEILYLFVFSRKIKPIDSDNTSGL